MFEYCERESFSVICYQQKMLSMYLNTCLKPNDMKFWFQSHHQWAIIVTHSVWILNHIFVHPCALQYACGCEWQFQLSYWYANTSVFTVIITASDVAKEPHCIKWMFYSKINCKYIVSLVTGSCGVWWACYGDCQIMISKKYTIQCRHRRMRVVFFESHGMCHEYWKLGCGKILLISFVTSYLYHRFNIKCRCLMCVIKCHYCAEHTLILWHLWDDYQTIYVPNSIIYNTWKGFYCYCKMCNLN